MTQCFKDSSEAIDCVYVIQTVHFSGHFRTHSSNVSIFSSYC
jgi:hypothetical protein